MSILLHGCLVKNVSPLSYQFVVLKGVLISKVNKLHGRKNINRRRVILLKKYHNSGVLVV
jgi:hypothetical protein